MHWSQVTLSTLTPTLATVSFRGERRSLNAVFYSPSTIERMQSAWTSCPEGSVILADGLSGVSGSTTYAPASVEELVLLSCVHRRLTLYACLVEHVTTRRGCSYEVLWSGGRVVAFTGMGAFDLEKTRASGDRRLVWCSLPHMAVCYEGTPVCGWGGDDEDDLMVVAGDSTHGWTVRTIGGKTYLLFPEKGQVVIGCCRALGMKRVVEQFVRYPRFMSTLQAMTPPLGVPPARSGG